MCIVRVVCTIGVRVSRWPGTVAMIIHGPTNNLKCEEAWAAEYDGDDETL